MPTQPLSTKHAWYAALVGAFGHGRAVISLSLPGFVKIGAGAEVSTGGDEANRVRNLMARVQSLALQRIGLPASVGSWASNRSHVWLGLRWLAYLHSASS